MVADLILYGPNAVAAAGLSLAIDEDQANDSERRHATEQVAYLVFESVPNQAPGSIVLDNQSVPENTPGAAVGQLQVTDPDVDDLHTFAVSDSRFVVEEGLLKLTADSALDYETEPVREPYHYCDRLRFPAAQLQPVVQYCC